MCGFEKDKLEKQILNDRGLEMVSQEQEHLPVRIFNLFFNTKFNISVMFETQLLFYNIFVYNGETRIELLKKKKKINVCKIKERLNSYI